ncbi:MAG: hypothetical protein HOP29_08735 [Phycisphaerales bacterium]|nr:hypothetical protein [Phycisphaerales bacterium]
MTAPFTFAPAGVGLLARMRARAIRNHVREVVAEAPVKVFATVVFIGLIWFALFKLFEGVFLYFKTSMLQSVVAIPLVFHFFFVALLVLLTFSNAILMYGALYTHEESAYLLSSPLRAHSTVVVKYAESLILSSWSLLLLGIPLMLAIASVQDESWFFYPLFVVIFVGFVPIPGALGLFTAWGVARYLPRTMRRWLVYIAVGSILATIVWGLQSVRQLRFGGEEWLDDFFARMSLVELSILPSTWVTRGIEAAVNDARGDAVRYLIVTLANALFLSWLAVHVVAHRFVVGYDRAGTTRDDMGPLAVRASAGLANRVFFFLPHPARLIAAKDLRTFVRDPMQWSQLAILFGLMALYLLNMPRFDLDESSSHWVVIVPFLNLTAVSFILATFTSRFVFPMVSLERHQFWLLGLLPISRAWILVAKFAFAFLVTFGVAAAVTLLAGYILRMRGVALVMHLMVIASICVGLCGLAVGVGARLPVLTHRNPARIANGLGGTINLIASVLLIVVALAGMFLANLSEVAAQTRLFNLPVTLVARWFVVAFCITAGAVAMTVGTRHLNRMEL